jgi:hypothetical protein
LAAFLCELHRFAIGLSSCRKILLLVDEVCTF